VLDGVVIEDLRDVLEFDTTGRGTFLPYVADKICLISKSSEQLAISNALDFIISEESNVDNPTLTSPAVSSTTDGTMSSIFSVSCYINILIEQFSIMDTIFTKHI
jgi:hypothetical protein